MNTSNPDLAECQDPDFIFQFKHRDTTSSWTIDEKQVQAPNVAIAEQRAKDYCFHNGHTFLRMKE